jgi:hypothetical protein
MKSVINWISYLHKIFLIFYLFSHARKQISGLLPDAWDPPVSGFVAVRHAPIRWPRRRGPNTVRLGIRAPVSPTSLIRSRPVRSPAPLSQAKLRRRAAYAHALSPPSLREHSHVIATSAVFVTDRGSVCRTSRPCHLATSSSHRSVGATSLLSHASQCCPRQGASSSLAVELSASVATFPIAPPCTPGEALSSFQPCCSSVTPPLPSVATASAQHATADQVTSSNATACHWSSERGSCMAVATDARSRTHRPQGCGQPTKPSRFGLGGHGSCQSCTAGLRPKLCIWPAWGSAHWP